MNKPKLKLGHVWPDLYVVPGAEREASKPGASKGTCISTAARRRGPAHSATSSRPSKPKGSYCLRRSAQQIVASVYLTRVLEWLERACQAEGNALLSEMALVWVSGDGSREVALKGNALRKLVIGRA